MSSKSPKAIAGLVDLLLDEVKFVREARDRVQWGILLAWPPGMSVDMTSLKGGS